MVGGTKIVYENRLFFLGWFGEGLRAPSQFIAKHADRNAKVGLATDPSGPNTVYHAPTLQYEMFNPKQRYDFVIVSYYKQIRTNFDEGSLNKDYELVYRELVDGADYAHVYRHK